MTRLGCGGHCHHLVYMPLSTFHPVTAHKCQGHWEMKVSPALCVRAPGKWLMPSDFPLNPLTSESDHLLPSGDCPPLVVEFRSTLAVPNGCKLKLWPQTWEAACGLWLPWPWVPWPHVLPSAQHSTAGTRAAPSHLTDKDWSSCFSLRVNFVNAWKREECGFWRTSNDVCCN